MTLPTGVSSEMQATKVIFVSESELECSYTGICPTVWSILGLGWFTSLLSQRPHDVIVSVNQFIPRAFLPAPFVVLVKGHSFSAEVGSVLACVSAGIEGKGRASCFQFPNIVKWLQQPFNDMGKVKPSLAPLW